MKKKMLALLLTTSVATGLVACGGNDTPETAAKKDAAKETQSASTQAAAQPTTAPAAEQKPLEKIVLWTNDFASDEGAQKAFCEQFYEDTGVTLEWVGFPKEDYEDVLQASLMSCNEEDLPDIIAAPDEIGVILRQELLYDMSDLIANNADISALIERNPAMTAEYKTSDGAVYALASSQFQSMSIWTRQDILDELKIPEITSVDELTEALRSIKAAHPDMIPLSAPMSLKAWEVVSNAFGVKFSIAKNAEGKYVDPTLTEEYKAFMDYITMLYSEGLVDKELPTSTSYGTLRKKFQSGQSAMLIMWDNNYKNLQNGLDSNGIVGQTGWINANDTEDGVLGIDYHAASSPYVMTVGVADEEAQQIFDTFFNWVYLNESGVITTALGPQDYAWEVIDGQYTDKEGFDVGNKSQSNPVMDPDFEFPFVFQEIDELRYKYAEMFRAEVIERADALMSVEPTIEYGEYSAIESDLDSKRTELFYLYVLGQCDYDYFCKEYKAKTEEVGLQAMLDEMNK